MIVLSRWATANMRQTGRKRERERETGVQKTRIHVITVLVFLFLLRWKIQSNVNNVECSVYVGINDITTIETNQNIAQISCYYHPNDNATKPTMHLHNMNVRKMNESYVYILLYAGEAGRVWILLSYMANYMVCYCWTILHGTGGRERKRERVKKRGACHNPVFVRRWIAKVM